MLLSYRWIALAIVTLTQTSVAIAFQTVPALSPFIIADLNLTRGGLGLLVSITQVGMVVSMLVSGLLVDRFGERLILTVAPLVVAAAAVSLLIHSLYWLPFAFFMIGVGASAVGPAGSKLVLIWFPPENRGLAMGVRQVAIPAGGALAAGLLPFMALRYGWTVAASMVGAFCLFFAAVAFFFYRNGPRSSPEPGKPDLQKPHFRSTLRRYRGRVLGLTTVWCTALIMGQFTLGTYLVLFLHQDLGIPLKAAIPMLLFAQIAGAVGRVLLGWTSDRFLGGNRRIGMFLAASIGIVITLCFSFLPGSILIASAPILAIIAGFALVGWNGLAVAHIIEMVPPREAATSIGLFMSFSQLGAVIGPAAFGFIADATGSYRTSWLMLAGVLLLGMWAGIRAQPALESPDGCEKSSMA